LIDSLIDSETALKYDKAWAALKPREVRLGWRAAGIVVHPTNPLSVISYSQLRGIYEGKIKDWSEVAAGSTEYGVQSTKYGVKNRKHVAKIGAEGVGAGKFAKGAIQLYGPPPEDPISLLLESKLWVGRQHVAVLPRSDIGKLIVSVARDPLALGVVDLAEMPPGEASVKMLMIEPPSPVLAAPSRDKLPRDYFLARPVGLWVSSQGSQQAQNFADFVGSGECATTLRRYGLVPNIVPVKTAVPPMSASSAAGGKKR
jgi:hypothetical protein